MTTPDLTSYDWIVISSSAGKDSQAMLDYVFGLAEAAGVLDRVVVVHADLGRVEWMKTRELAERQAARYSARFEVVKNLTDLLWRIATRGKWPSATERYCTSDFKRGPIRTLHTRLAREWKARGGKGACRILDCMGLRAQESTAREKCNVCKDREVPSKGRVSKRWVSRSTCTTCRGTGKRNPLVALPEASSRNKEVWEWLPVHAWKLEEVWARIKASRTHDLAHPAYALGMPRLSCVFCIFAPQPALILAGKHNPELLAEYVRVEQKIGHTFTKRKPTANNPWRGSIAEIKEAVDAGETVDPTTMNDAWNM